MKEYEEQQRNLELEKERLRNPPPDPPSEPEPFTESEESSVEGDAEERRKEAFDVRQKLEFRKNKNSLLNDRGNKRYVS